MRRPILNTLFVLTALCAPALAFAEPGDMMHMSATIKMQVANAPVDIPAQSFNKDICVSKHRDPRDIVTQSQRNKTCTVTGFKVNGGSGSFHYTCGGEMQVAGDGNFATKADGGSHVTITTAGTVHGQAMSMNMTFDTTPAGASCEYTPRADAQ